MTDPTMQQVMVELATLRAEVATIRRQHSRRRTARRLFPLALVGLLVALVPLSSLAAISFNDLNASSVHNANIQAIADAGITKGCDPGVSYCPNGLVTREEMASFLARTAGLGGNAPVVNALTAQTATNASNANSVGGYAPNRLVRVAQAAAVEGANTPLTGAYATILSVTLTVPGPGFVVVSGTTIGRSTADACSTRCPVLVRLRDTGPGGGTSAPLSTYVTNVMSDLPLAPSHVFAVNAAGARTFTLEASKYLDGFMGVAVSNTSLTALYVPFGSTGTAAP